MRGGGDERRCWSVRHGGEAWLECCRCYESHPCWMTERRGDERHGWGDERHGWSVEVLLE